MSKPEAIIDEVENLTNVRWKIPADVIAIINSHQSMLRITWKRKTVTQEEAAIDLIRSRSLPKLIIVQE